MYKKINHDRKIWHEKYGVGLEFSSNTDGIDKQVKGSESQRT